MEQKKARGRPPGPVIVHDAAKKGKHYKRFFDSHVSDAIYRPAEEVFEASYIGASYWTSPEKVTFFRALDNTQDPSVIATSINTKSILEIREYILTLQEALTEHQSNELTDHEAAHDVTEECQAALDAKADALERTSLSKLAEEEQTKYGEEWLLDADIAEQLDEQYALQEGARHTTNSLSIPSAELVSLATLLELSRNVFMNHGTNKALQYTGLPIRLHGVDEPALFRSAFEALHDICVDYTKRLVTAAHFQALCRLRAHTDDRLKPVVKGVDVRTALDIMDIDQPDAQKYWAKKVKEYGIRLYSESRELNDGRHHCRGHGYELTLLESMTALEQDNAETGMGHDAGNEGWESSNDNSSLSADQSAHGNDVYDVQSELVVDDDSDTAPDEYETESDSNEEELLQREDTRTSRDDENILRRLLHLPQLPEILDEDPELHDGGNEQVEDKEGSDAHRPGSADPRISLYHDQSSTSSEVTSASTQRRSSSKDGLDVDNILSKAHLLVQPLPGLKSKPTAIEVHKRKRKRRNSDSNHSKRHRSSSSE